MKLTSLILFVCLIALAACTTTQFATGTRIVVRRATVEVLRATKDKHPEYRAIFVVSATAIDQLLLVKDLDRAKIAAALQSLKIRELKGTEGALLVSDIIDIIDNAVAEKPLVGENLAKLKEILAAVSGGIADGVALSVARENEPAILEDTPAQIAYDTGH